MNRADRVKEPLFKGAAEAPLQYNVLGHEVRTLSNTYNLGYGSTAKIQRSRERGVEGGITSPSLPGTLGGRGGF